MKKLFALLSVVFCIFVISTTAMAASEFILDSGTLGLEDQLLPDTTYRYELYVDGHKVDVSSSNFEIDKETNDGGSYISSFGTSGGEVVVSTRSSYTIHSDDPKYINLDMDLEARKDIEDGNGNVIVYEGDRFSFDISEDYGNDLIIVTGYDSISSADYYDGGAGRAVYYAEDERGYVIFEESSMDAAIKFNTGERIYVDIYTNPISAVSDKYDTSGASIDYYQFAGKPAIRNTATLTVGGGFSYVYHMEDDGTLTRLDADESSGKLTWDVSGNLESYVVSTKALVAESTGSDDSQSGGETTTEQSQAATTTPSTPSTTTPTTPSVTTPSVPATDNTIDGPAPVDPAKQDPPEQSSEDDSLIISSAPEQEIPTIGETTDSSTQPSWLVFVLIGLCIVVVGACIFVIGGGQGGRHSKK